MRLVVVTIHKMVISVLRFFCLPSSVVLSFIHLSHQNFLETLKEKTTNQSKITYMNSNNLIIPNLLEELVKKIQSKEIWKQELRH